jgi:hypothetical protein
MSKQREIGAGVPAGDDPAAFARPRLRKVANTAFAGRIGGNQEFVALNENEESQALLEKQPDAVSCDVYAEPCLGWLLTAVVGPSMQYRRITRPEKLSVIGPMEDVHHRGLG